MKRENLRILAQAYKTGSLQQLNSYDRISQLAHLSKHSLIRTRYRFTLRASVSKNHTAHPQCTTGFILLNLKNKGVIQSKEMSEHFTYSVPSRWIDNRSEQIWVTCLLGNFLQHVEHAALLPYFKVRSQPLMPAWNSVIPAGNKDGALSAKTLYIVTS